MSDPMQEVINEVASRRGRPPEAVSVFVVTDDEAMARLAGPRLAALLWPGRRYGEALHVERAEGGFEVAVEVDWRPVVNPRGFTLIEGGRKAVGPCPCECNRGGFCGGCGHAGCSGGINLR